MYVKKLTIENLRSLESVQFEFNAPGKVAGVAFPNVNVVLGGNGSGKSSVLRAVALALLGPLLSSSSGFVPESLIRRPPRRSSGAATPALRARIEAAVELSAFDLKGDLKQANSASSIRLSLETTVEARGTVELLLCKCSPQSMQHTIEEALFDESSAGYFVVGYGASRRVESSTGVDESARTKARLKRYGRVAGLFEEHLGLIPLSYWLPKYSSENKGRYVQVMHLLDELLPPECRIEPLASNSADEHTYLMNEVSLPFRALSDGYRAYIGWIGDMLFHLCMGAGKGKKLRETEGVVLVDEIDLHLHPEWQRVVVPTLAKALPRVQFIVTTHSPLVVGSLQARNLYVLKEEGGATTASQLTERVHGRSAEQILLSPYFGLDSTRSPEVARMLQLLSGRAAAGDKDAATRYLEVLSKGLAFSDIAPTLTALERGNRKASADARRALANAKGPGAPANGAARNAAKAPAKRVKKAAKPPRKAAK